MSHSGSKPFRLVQGAHVIYGLPPESPCPCGSQIPLERCCLTPSGFRPAQHLTAPPGPPTGISTSGCYASVLKNCSSKLSLEHYISGAILRRLNQASEPFGAKAGDLRVTGFPWITPGEFKRLHPNAYVSRVLCERHNTALSAIDSIAGRLFSAIDDMEVEFAKTFPAPTNRLYLFNGNDIERWILKSFCGLVVSGNLVIQGRPVSMEIPPEWIEVLFGVRSFSPGQGLYVSRTIGETFQSPRGLEIGPVGRGKRLAGVEIKFNGYSFMVLMEPESETRREYFGKIYAYRPLEIHNTDGRSEKSFSFFWEGPADGGTIHFTVGDNLPIQN